MKNLLGFLFVGFLISTIAASCVSGYTSWKIYQQMQYLQLADDASTPAQKSEFLNKFITAIDIKSLPDYSAFIFKHARNYVPNQIKVLESLKQRCDELAKVNPADLGYAQGMQQITGQEFDHALSEVKSIIEGALWVEAGWWLCYGWLILLILTVILGFLIAVAYNH